MTGAPMTGALIASLIFMALHEFDAVACREWRILPGLSALSEPIARPIFLWAHVPMAALGIWILVLGPASTLALIYAGFAVVHVPAHLIYLRHPENRFTGLTSWIFIVGSGVAGLVHLGIFWMGA